MDVGTIRVKTKNLQTYKKTKNSWRKINKSFPHLIHVVELFKAHNNLSYLVDKKDPQFLKGQLSPEGQPQGARIPILPNGKKLDKAYSLFASHLTVHDQNSDDHWDVLYQNKGGTYSYVYTLEKKARARKRKYGKVDLFGKYYTKLNDNVVKNLNKDPLALPMYTLLKTYMRVGNEIYFKKNGHKGLTTLQKKDLKVVGKKVRFKYFGKDGVPQFIEQEFPLSYIKKLKQLLKDKKNKDFVFSKNNHPLPEKEFKAGFKKFCGKEFYPHIVRSYYATSKVQEFLKGRKKVKKKEAENLFLEIAHNLGHKRYNKKRQVWEDHYSVTLHHYIKPELVEKVKSKIAVS